MRIDIGFFSYEERGGRIYCTRNSIKRGNGVLNWLWAGLMLLAIIAGAVNGRLDEVTMPCSAAEGKQSRWH